jgi:7-cyano-7-deazaguanine tRNA-ribosyltransferase
MPLAAHGVIADGGLVLIVAGLSLKNLQPRVWDADSPYYLPALRAVMVSYAEFHQVPARMERAKSLGLRRYLGVPRSVQVYLDNGAFYFLRTGGVAERKAYEEFVVAARPDWYPIAFDMIPTPCMSPARQRRCFDSTMDANRAYKHDGYVPVVHVCSLLEEYVAAVRKVKQLAAKRRIALGGIVPNLLRASKALSYARVLESLSHVREEFADKEVHVFGIGGNATVHLAALLGIDSADSSGWRNRAARGLVQLPGTGDRMVTSLGRWRGRVPSKEEWDKLRRCACPACKASGVRGIKAGGLKGFCHRATHNLWVLLEEAAWMKRHIAAHTYATNYRRRLDNSTYLPLIAEVVKSLRTSEDTT